MNEDDASVAGARRDSGWALAARLLSIPPLLTAVGALLLWLVIGMEWWGVGPLEQPWVLQSVVGPVFIAGFYVAGHGAFFAPPFLIVAVIIASIASARGRRRATTLRRTWLVILLGTVSIAMAWAGLPRLL
jgi:hypothetical protein